MEAMDRLLEEKRGFSLKRVYEYSRMWNEWVSREIRVWEFEIGKWEWQVWVLVKNYYWRWLSWKTMNHKRLCKYPKPYLFLTLSSQPGLDEYMSQFHLNHFSNIWLSSLPYSLSISLSSYLAPSKKKLLFSRHVLLTPNYIFKNTSNIG